jgi:hypothetical protein
VRRSTGSPYFLAYLALQALTVVGVQPGEFPDSESYFHLNLLGGASRLPTVPVLYKIFPTDSLRMWAQVLLAAAAWWALAAVASSLVSDRRARFGLWLVILAIGVAAPVVNWNSLMLSESVAISLTALLIAAWLRFSRQANWQTAAQLLGVTLLWTFTRQPHVLLTLLVAIAAIVAAARSSAERWIKTAVALGLAVIAIAGLVEIHRNQTISISNVGSIIQQRILPHRGWTRWFVEHGMPYSDSVAARAGVPFHYDARDPEYFDWIRKHGTGVYLRFVAEHPKYTFVDPLPYFPGEQESFQFRNHSPFASLEPNPTPSLLSPVVNYGRHRNVLPSVVDKLLFDQGEIGDVLVLAALGVFLTAFAWRRFGPDRRIILPAIVAASAVPQGYLVWLAGGEAVGELDRLSIVTAVSLRVGLWILLALAADRLFRAQAT